jgi:hypothetical protein
MVATACITCGDEADNKAHFVVPPGQCQRSTERHGLGLSRLRQPKDSARGMARMCSILSSHFQPRRSNGQHFQSYVPCPCGRSG